MLWKPELTSSKSGKAENEIEQIALELAKELKPGDRVLLEGSMGVGKTTFTRALLSGLSVVQPPEGSPTFAIAHEYEAPVGGVVHIDYYRLKSEDEIDDAGIPTYYWERNLIVISEWLSSFPDFEARVLESGRIWQINLRFFQNDQEINPKREISITLHQGA